MLWGVVSMDNDVDMARLLPFWKPELYPTRKAARAAANTYRNPNNLSGSFNGKPIRVQPQLKVAVKRIYVGVMRG